MTNLGAHFGGQWFRTYCALKGIVHAEAISYRSATNGRAERAIAQVLDVATKGTSGPPPDPTTHGTNWITNDYAVSPQLVDDIIETFGVRRQKVDCFASKDNKRFERYWSKDDSAWDKHWGPQHSGLLWMNPPYNMIAEMTQKLKKDGAQAILVVPGWQEENWWSELQDIVIDEMRLPHKRGSFHQCGEKPMPPPRWPVWAFLVDGGLHAMAEAEC